MFDIGFWELVILFGLGLIVLGPERLPKVANQLGNWAGQARRMARNLTAQMRSEIDFDLNDPLKSHQSKSSEPAKPEWQTSAGLKPGFSSNPESTSADTDDVTDKGAAEKSEDHSAS